MRQYVRKRKYSVKRDPETFEILSVHSHIQVRPGKFGRTIWEKGNPLRGHTAISVIQIAEDQFSRTAR